MNHSNSAKIRYMGHYSEDEVRTGPEVASEKDDYTPVPRSIYMSFLENGFDPDEDVGWSVRLQRAAEADMAKLWIETTDNLGLIDPVNQLPEYRKLVMHMVLDELESILEHRGIGVDPSGLIEEGHYIGEERYPVRKLVHTVLRAYNFYRDIAARKDFSDETKTLAYEVLHGYENILDQYSFELVKSVAISNQMYFPIRNAVKFHPKEFGGKPLL